MESRRRLNNVPTSACGDRSQELQVPIYHTIWDRTRKSCNDADVNIIGRQLVSSRSAWPRSAAASASPSVSWMTLCSSTPSRLVKIIILGVPMRFILKCLLMVLWDSCRLLKRIPRSLLKMTLRNCLKKVWSPRRFSNLRSHIRCRRDSNRVFWWMCFDKGLPRITCHACRQCRPREPWPLLARTQTQVHS